MEDQQIIKSGNFLKLPCLCSSCSPNNKVEWLYSTSKLLAFFNDNFKYILIANCTRCPKKVSPEISSQGAVEGYFNIKMGSIIGRKEKRVFDEIS